MRRSRFEMAGDVARLFLISPDGAERVALVDRSDLAAVLDYGLWRASFYKRKSSIGGGYWVAWACRRQRVALLHRLVTDAPKGLDVDHINRDTLDNRRCNLRLATKSENQQNIVGHRDSRSGHRNVYWQERRQSWLVQVCVDGKRHHGGTFKDFDQACAAADAMRRRLHPCCPENSPVIEPLPGVRLALSEGRVPVVSGPLSQGLLGLVAEGGRLYCRHLNGKPMIVAFRRREDAERERAAARLIDGEPVMGLTQVGSLTLDALMADGRYAGVLLVRGAKQIPIWFGAGAGEPVGLNTNPAGRDRGLSSPAMRRQIERDFS